MEEKILIKSERKSMMAVCLIFPVIGLLAFLAYFMYSVNSYRTEWGYWKYGEYSMRTYTISEAISKSIDCDGALPFVALAIPVFIIIGIIFYKCWSKVELTVTDKRVYGKAAFGKRVDLPLDSVSSVGTSGKKGIDVGTSSGRIKFKFIKNYSEIHEVLSKLIMERQNKEAVKTEAVSNADELKKYKELLDSGVITEQDFEKKKKQLLGL